MEFKLSPVRALLDVTFDEPHASIKRVKSPSPQGCCDKLGEYFVGLFVQDKKLHLIVNGIVREVRGTRVAATFHAEREDRQLTIVIDQPVITIAYKQTERPASTPFYTETEEDVDFGLWLAKILNSKERREIFIQSWSK
jgi:hypothetical protein